MAQRRANGGNDDGGGADADMLAALGFDPAALRVAVPSECV